MSTLEWKMKLCLHNESQGLRLCRSKTDPSHSNGRGPFKLFSVMRLVRNPTAP